MSAVLFTTPTTLDLRAITTFGINAKPNSSSPIGFFGTGLKYAIAVCLREGCGVVLWIGKQKYTFHLERESFRDKEFGFISMVHQPEGWFKKPVVTRLPFTTELGKNWKLWMAFRELYSNTLDECGKVEAIDYPTSISDELDMQGVEGSTRITLTGENFLNEFYDRDKNFYPEASRHRESSDAVQHFFEGSQHVYYRGMRVMDLEKPSRITYNILSQIELTEDRTAKYPYEVERILRDHITQSTDKELIKLVLEAQPGTYENRFNFGSSYTPPGDDFANMARARSHLPNTTVRDYMEAYDPPTRAQAVKLLAQQFIDHLNDSTEHVLVTWIYDNKDAIIDEIESGKFSTSAF